MKSKELTTTQAAVRLAEILGESVGGSTVRLWCTQGKFPHARSLDTPRGSVWLIPESDLKNFKKPVMGRPRKPKGAPGEQQQEKSAA